ncbi:MAG: ATP-grasp domain-containing protein [Planctomycetota bacterium]|nr:MAG: ATP-grasp domain-containing protein [Planctomycetota bacterium]
MSHEAESGVDRLFSCFEFWPSWLVYAPVAVAWLAWALRYRSLTLPLLVNPCMPMAGFVGSSKAAVLRYAAATAHAAILPWIVQRVDTRPLAQQVRQMEARAAAAGIAYPCVVKPDMGCRGSGVKLVHDAQELSTVVAAYRPGMDILLQRVADHEPEVGIFWVRHPHERRGRVVSLTDKTTPAVVGDGQRTLGQLVAADPRMAALQHLYRQRNHAHWDQVLPLGQRHRLLFSASHCRGAVFTDLRQDITPQLQEACNDLLSDLPDFHYGRLDVKYRDREQLRAGKDLQIIEINGASAEAIHIWDRRTTLFEALRTLLWQYRSLFTYGAALRQRGLRPPSLGRLWRAARREFRLRRFHPETD